MNRLSVVSRSSEVELLPPDDILRGAAAIAEFLLNDRNERRVVYHLFEKGRLPAFRLGSRIYARKSSLSAWIDRLEAEQSKRVTASDQNSGE